MNQWLIEPLIGGIIGCFTNYLAIKMLFRPYAKKTFLGLQVPFTPGIIPKRKDDMASAIASIVCKELIDEDSFIEALCNDRITEKIVKSIMKSRINTEFELYELDKKITDIIEGIIVNSDLKGMISKECFSHMKRKFAGSIILKYIHDDLLHDISDAAGMVVMNYFDNGGVEPIANKVVEEIDSLSGMTVEEVLIKYNMSPTVLSFKIKDYYTNYVKENISDLLQKADLESLIKAKIENMDIRELEKMLIFVMKNELNAIVYLGALIGIIIGIINVFI